MNHSQIELYSRADSLSGWLYLLIFAGAMVLGFFLFVGFWCLIQGLRHRQDRPSRRAWRKHGK